LKKVAFLYATFPRPTETFVRRELRALEKYSFWPDLYSIWRGKHTWENREVHTFNLWNLFLLVYWIPHWFLKKPKQCKEVLCYLWSNPCYSFQNWCETFLGLAFALVEAGNFKKKDYHLIHAVWATLPATSAFTISKLVGIEFSMGAHAYDVFRHGGDWLLHKKLTAARFVRTSSQSTANRLHQLGVESKDIKLIKRSLSFWPQRSHFHLVYPGKLTLLSVGRLVEKKGYFHMLSLACLLKKSGIPFSLEIVGNGPLRRDLLIERRRLGVKKEISFSGSLDQKSVRQLYLESDAFLFTGIVDRRGDRDGIPNVVPEALAAGMLVLASDRAGAPEAFTDGKTGFSMDPENPKSWVRLLKSFLESPQKYEQVRKNAQLEVQENFDSSKNGLMLLRSYNNL
jgi:colanic acid/amylovoran biosynthesis glycosyltransferase